MTLQEQLVILLVGFLLTTLLGGALGYYFQNRSWTHQHNVSMTEAERQIATSVFEQLSMMMDKRLYRMRQLRWKLDDENTPAAMLEKALDDYRAVLFEWNDNLNRNSALVQRYFGVDTRVQLEDVVYEEFARIGEELDRCYRSRLAGRECDDLSRMARDLNLLSDNIYLLNVSMIGKIQEGLIGRRIADQDPSMVGAIQ